MHIKKRPDLVFKTKNYLKIWLTESSKEVNYLFFL